MERPVLRAMATENGRENYALNLSAVPRASVSSLRIVDGRALVSLAGLHADFKVAFAAQRSSEDASATEITVEARGTYAGQSVVARFVGGMPLDSAPPRGGGRSS